MSTQTIFAVPHCGCDSLPCDSPSLITLSGQSSSWGGYPTKMRGSVSTEATRQDVWGLHSQLRFPSSEIPGIVGRVQCDSPGHKTSLVTALNTLFFSLIHLTPLSNHTLQFLCFLRRQARSATHTIFPLTQPPPSLLVHLLGARGFWDQLTNPPWALVQSLFPVCVSDF